MSIVSLLIFILIKCSIILHLWKMSNSFLTWCNCRRETDMFMHITSKNTKERRCEAFGDTHIQRSLVAQYIISSHWSSRFESILSTTKKPNQLHDRDYMYSINSTFSNDELKRLIQNARKNRSLKSSEFDDRFIHINKKLYDEINVVSTHLHKHLSLL